jgi:hypothetical protein
MIHTFLRLSQLTLLKRRFSVGYTTPRSDRMHRRHAWPTRVASWLLALPLAATAASDQTPLILFDQAVVRSTHLPDFSYAGYGFGEKAIPIAPGTIVNVADFGAIANDALDDSVAVLAALKAAHAVKGPVTLRFPAGRFILSEILFVERSDFVIDGAGRGSGGTELYFPRPLRMVDRTNRLDELRAYLTRENKRQIEPLNHLDEAFTAHSWSGGFIWTQAPNSRPVVYLNELTPKDVPSTAALAGSADQMRLRVAPDAPIKAGDVIQIHWYSRDGRTSKLIDSMYGPNYPTVGQRLWEDPKRAIVVQTTRVEEVGKGSLRIADPLLHDIGPDMPANILPWRGLSEVGIRDLALVFPPGRSFGHHVEEGWNGIYMTDVFNGWIESVRATDADSGILTYNSASLSIRDIVTEGRRKAHYSVHIGSVHNVLVSDLQVKNQVVHSLSFNTQSTRSVFQRATLWNEPVLDQHAGGNHQNLFDNVTFYIAAERKAGKPQYALWNGSGAAYWEPGHGRFNTHWNFRVDVLSGALASETVLLTGLDEGPDARIVGLSGNRTFDIDYRPKPYFEMINMPMRTVPSLYDWQLNQRLRNH